VEVEVVAVTLVPVLHPVAAALVATFPEVCQ
jgi:hypothetical protein